MCLVLFFSRLDGMLEIRAKNSMNQIFRISVSYPMILDSSISLSAWDIFTNSFPPTRDNSMMNSWMAKMSFSSTMIKSMSFMSNFSGDPMCLLLIGFFLI